MSTVSEKAAPSPPASGDAIDESKIGISRNDQSSRSGSEPPPPTGRRGRSRRWVVVLLGAVGLGLLGLLVWTLLTLTGVLSHTVGVMSARPGGARSNGGTGVVQWRRHIDPQAGFAIDYPDGWVSFPTSDRPGVQFLVGPDSRNLVEVRVIQLPVVVGGSDAVAMKTIIDQVLGTEQLDILSESQVTYSGLRGWQYVYGVRAGDGTAGVHVHVFLFDGNRLHTLMFQALPAANLKTMAPIFDAILARYRALPAVAAPSASGAPSGAASPTP